MTQKYRIRFIILSNWCDVGFLMHGNVEGMQRAGSVADSLSTVTALASEPGA